MALIKLLIARCDASWIFRCFSSWAVRSGSAGEMPRTQRV